MAEGRALGPGIERATSLYCAEKGVGSEREWREKARAEGVPCTCMNIGLATWDDTREALGSIYEDALSRGVRPPDRFNLLAERRMGLPKALRAQAPQETGPVLWTDRHWWEMTHTVPIEPEAADNMIGGPGSVDNVVNALQVGITCIGVLSQYSWRWPYWDDETAQLMAVLKASAEALARARLESRIIVACNRDIAPAVADLLAAGARVRIVPNVLPAIRRLDIEPARAAIHDEFIRHVMRGKGLSEAEEFHRSVIMPTPEAVLRATRLLAAGAGPARPADVVVIDLGGATTDVHAAVALKPVAAGIRLAGLPPLPLTRTVEGDLGMRWSAPGALAADGAWLKVEGRAAGATPEALRSACARRQREPDFLPDGPAEAHIDRSLAIACVTHALRRHCGALRTVYVPGQGADLVQQGADLSDVPLMIGTGGLLSRHAMGEAVLREALERQPQGALAPRAPALALDRRYVLAAAGLLATVDAKAARTLLADQGFAAAPPRAPAPS